MKQRLYAAVLALIFVLVLAGCGCDHQWQDATCDAPRTCALCEKTEGEPLGHSWQDATCSEPQTCNACGKTEGDPLGHSWLAATCDAPQTCDICGETEGDPLAHSWEQVSQDLLACQNCDTTTAAKYVAITFDDGPSGKYTQALLEGLAERNVKATFFLCGYRIETYPSMPQEIHDQGHEIGLHGYSHTYLSKLTRSEILKELKDTLAMLPGDCEVALLRPPGGFITDDVKQVSKDLGLSIIMWSVDPEDWNCDDPVEIETRIVNAVRDGDIILMHDMSTSSVEAALNTIDTLTAQGYLFVTVSELAQIQGSSLTSGERYSQFRKT